MNKVTKADHDAVNELYRPLKAEMKTEYENVRFEQGVLGGWDVHFVGSRYCCGTINTHSDPDIPEFTPAKGFSFESCDLSDIADFLNKLKRVSDVGKT